MDWINVIELLISSGVVVSVVEFFHYRRENKRIKHAEATTATTAAQSEQIDLGKKFITDSLEIMEQVRDLQKQSSEQSIENQREILERLEVLDKRIDKQELQLDHIERYLNGDYHNWLAKNN